MNEQRLKEIKERWSVGQPRMPGSLLFHEQMDVDWLVEELEQRNKDVTHLGVKLWETEEEVMRLRREAT